MHTFGKLVFLNLPRLGSDGLSKLEGNLVFEILSSFTPALLYSFTFLLAMSKCHQSFGTVLVYPYHPSEHKLN